MAIMQCAAGVILRNFGVAWRMTVKELTHTITKRFAGGEKHFSDVI